MNNIYTVPKQHRVLFTRIEGFDEVDLHSQQGRDCVDAIDATARYNRHELNANKIQMAWISCAQECRSILGSY